jgi:hypothetical protein
MIISFPPTQYYVDESESVIFPADVGQETIGCSISLAALQDHFQGHLLKPLEAFICNRPAIERIAERLITQRRFEEDGSVLIRTADCNV